MCAELQAFASEAKVIEPEAVLDGLSLEGQRHETLEHTSVVFVSLPKHIA